MTVNTETVPLNWVNTDRVTINVCIILCKCDYIPECRGQLPGDVRTRKPITYSTNAVATRLGGTELHILTHSTEYRHQKTAHHENCNIKYKETTHVTLRTTT